MNQPLKNAVILWCLLLGAAPGLAAIILVVALFVGAAALVGAAVLDAVGDSAW